jgi:peptidoglycan/LPS O-acetylase OafA/YrhL
MRGHRVDADRLVRRLGFEPAFDGVRGIAVLLVVALHLRLVAPGAAGSLAPDGGFLGVDVFFVLSGFLITALLLREVATGRVRVGAFYRRRALRLMPAVVALAAVHVGYAAVVGLPGALERSSILSVLFYWANWKLVYADGWPLIAEGLAHTWSLAVEEQFYLVWPLCMLAVARRRSQGGAFFVLIAFAAAAVAVWRAVLVRADPPGIVYFRTDTRADALLVGALGAYAWTRGWIPRPRVLAAAAWCSLLFLVAMVVRADPDDRFLFDGGFTLVAVASTVVLLALLETGWTVRRVLELRPLRVVGRVSYGVYLWHYFVFTALATRAEGWSDGVRLAAGLAITAAAVSASWFLVERPFLAWKDRLERRTTDVPERVQHELARPTVAVSDA